MAAGVPLEFAEEDEDFVLYGDASNSREDGGSVSVSTPSSGPGEAGECKDDENNWSWEENAKVDEVGEQFQEISVVGLMDEEQALTKHRSRSLAR